MLRGRIGIALGSGGARGFAHIGVLRALEEAGIRPEVVAGTSAGAVIGAAYAAGRLDEMEKWARSLDRRAVMALLDVSFRGGALRGRRVTEQVASFLPEGDLAEVLERPYVAVATDLESGREVWIRDGSLADAIHASSAVPGVISPVLRDGRWLVDGGVVNPVPIAPCRALGAESIIAVDLNATLLKRRFRGESEPEPEHAGSASAGAVGQLWAELRHRFAGAGEPHRHGVPSPGLYDVLGNTLEIMQLRIARSRMAGDPPELLVTPRLPDFALLELYRAAEAIDEGWRAARRALAVLDESGPATPLPLPGEPQSER
jgi:NTE family protein